MTRWWRQWWRRPRTLWLRRISFQVHLWTGVVLSLYVVMLSLTGSVLVYRAELTRAFDIRRPAFDQSARSLSEEELRAAAGRAFPDHTIVRIDTQMSRRDPTFEVWFERGDERLRHAFNPYTGEDLGDWFPAGVRAMIWLARLHDDLLLDRRRRAVNGAGAVLITLLTLTGAVVWWPGIRSWRRALTVKWRARWPRLNWDLHSASGFWLYLVILNWSITGIYLAFPTDFVEALHYLAPSEASVGLRWGDILLEWLTRVHFGRWRNPFLKALWCLMGLVPALLAVTGVVMWWNRAVRRHAPSASMAASIPASV